MTRKKTKQNKTSRNVTAKGKPKPDGMLLPSYHDLTDLGNGERLIDKYGNVIRFCPESKTWFVYDGKRWKPDSGQMMNSFAAEVVRGIPQEALQPGLSADEVKAILKHAMKSSSRGGMKSMIEVAKWLPPIVVHPDQLDTNQWLLNCVNGTLNLRTWRTTAT